jgi:hypothetical protein
MTSTSTPPASDLSSEYSEWDDIQSDTKQLPKAFDVLMSMKQHDEKQCKHKKDRDWYEWASDKMSRMTVAEVVRQTAKG